MYGAILGDIIGSPFEFDRGEKTKDFELFLRGCNFTDDSVMTIAVAEALISVGPEASENTIKDAVISNMQDWGKRYPNAGYGGRFRFWLHKKNPKPYGSYGNGSAMRVSAVGWLYPTIERTREVARFTAEVTHNHIEGIKGAEATASCIYFARNGATKEYIKKYVEDEFGYDLNRTLDEIRPYYHHVESCQETVPEAIIAFLEADGFEDAIRNAVSLGGDTDTLAAITGSIAEAFYDMSAIMRAECRNRIDDDMLEILEMFDEIIGRVHVDAEENEDLAGNDGIEIAINQMYEKDDKDSFIFFLTVLCSRMRIEGHILVPFVTLDENAFCDMDVYNMKEGDAFEIDHDIRMRMDTVTEGKGEEWLCIFTNVEELRKQHTGNVIMSIPLSEMLEISLQNEKVKGVVINPFGRYVRLDKEILTIVLKEYNDNWKKKEEQ